MEDVNDSSFFLGVFTGLCEKIWANFPFPYLHIVKLCNKTFLCNKHVKQQIHIVLILECSKGRLMCICLMISIGQDF